MRMKRMIAMFSVICLIIGMLPARSFSVRAEEDVEVKGVTFSSGAVQDGNNRYLIYLDVDGTTAEGELPGEENPNDYWNNNTVYIDGEKVSGDGVNYAFDKNTATNKRQLMLCLKYVCVEKTATTGANIGKHLLYIPAGTIIGKISTKNDICIKIDGTSVSETYGVTFTRSGGGAQDNLTRYQVIFTLSGIDSFPDGEGAYWNGNNVLIDGVETQVNFGFASQSEPLQLAAYVQYDQLQLGATTAASAGTHLMEIPAGSFIGNLAILETVRVIFANGAIIDAKESELSFVSGGGQDNFGRYLIYLKADEVPTENLGDNDIYIDGELVEGIEIYVAGEDWFLIVPYSVIPNGTTTAETMGNHEISIPKGSLIGNYVTTNDLTITIANSSITKKNTLTLELKGSAVNENNQRYDITFSLGSAAAEGSYWNDQTIYVDGVQKTEGVHWLPYKDENTFVLYLDYDTVQTGAEHYYDVTETHIVSIPKGTWIGDIYIEKDMILQITGATVTQLEKDPSEREILNVGTTNDWRNSWEDMSGVYFGTTVADPLSDALDFTSRYELDDGTISYNGSPLSGAQLIKVTPSLYYITVERCNVTWKTGDTIVLDGMVKSVYTDVVYQKIGFIRNRDGSFSQYDETADTQDKTVAMEDVYVDMETETYMIPSAPLITNGLVEVTVDGNATTDYMLTQFGEHEVKRKVEDTVHMEAVSGITNTTYVQNIVLYKLGDANGDGRERSIKDLISIKKQADSNATGTYSKMAKRGADMNYDDKITKEDADIMREYLVGKATLDEVREKYDDEVVVGVISDMHYANDASDAQRRINTKKALNYYKSQNADLIYMNGDISDLGGTASYEKLVEDITAVYPDAETRPTFFMSADNHEYFEAWSHGSFTPTATFAQLQERFCTSLASVRGESTGTNAECEINGYHFISISSDGMNGASATYSDATKAYLKTCMQNAQEADPKKPIFVGIHQPPKNTVIGSGIEYSTELTSILEQYPQAVVFTSHTHDSIMDERSIWQGDTEGEYTVVNTAALYYLNGYSETEIGQRYAQGLLVRVNDNAVDIKRYDFWNDEQIKDDWIIETPSDPTSFTYIYNARNAQRVAPEFPADATVTSAWTDDKTAELSFAAATHDDFVYQYKVAIYQNGSYLRTDVFDSYYFLGLHRMPTTVVLKVGKLNAAANYEFKITALESWGKESTTSINGSLRAR